MLDLMGSCISSKSFKNVVSLNPENAVVAVENESFRKIYFNTNSIAIADGIGILWAAKMLQIENVSRTTGADLMCEIVKKHKDKKILFLGGKYDVAEKVVQYFKNQVNNNGEFIALGGVDKNDTNLINEVVKINPDILFVAFGSPHQELWIESNSEKLSKVLCMGVGGGFDFIAGILPRAPTHLRNLGLEWLFRLFIEPWRVKRQLRLVRFVWLVFLAKLKLV